MKLLKPAILSAGLISAVTISAYAAEPVPTTPTNPPQVATHPGVPYSSARPPGPKASSGNSIPSPSSSAPAAVGAPTAAPETDGSYYSSKGFGPKPN
jgi:cell division protein FtsN